jgi:hypothetical protein
MKRNYCDSDHFVFGRAFSDPATVMIEELGNRMMAFEEFEVATSLLRTDS